MKETWQGRARQGQAGQGMDNQNMGGRKMQRTNKSNGSQEIVTISLPKRERVTITVFGDTPYVGTNFSQQVREDLLQEQTGKAKTKARAARNPEAEAKSRRHIIDEYDCIPCEAFRAAMIDTAKDDTLKGVSGEAVRRSISIQGDVGNYIIIKNGDGQSPHSGPKTFEAVVKLANGQRHIAFRPSYDTWSASFSIIYLADRFSQQDVLNLLARAGITTGVGDTRRIGGGRFYLKGND